MNEIKHELEWIDTTLPLNWTIRRAKEVLYEINERSEFGEENLLAVSAYYGIAKKKDVIDDGDFLTRANTLEGYKKCGINDLVINIMLAWNRGLGVSPYEGIVSPSYSVFRCTSEIYPKYVHYLLRTSEYTTYFKRYSTGIIDSRLRLYPETFLRLNILTPPLAEQISIANFLDRKTAAIDALIAKKERQIELLQEKRQIIINNAITKGLDPNVPMKDSGVEWIGEIPAGWRVTRLKFSTKKIVDCPHETPIYNAEGDFCVIRTADVSFGGLNTQTCFRVDEDEYLTRIRRCRLEPNDIVYGREGERWGFAGLVPKEPSVCLGQRMMQFRSNDMFNPEFLMWQLNTKIVYCQGQVDTVGATSPHVNVETIKNYVLYRPPIMEQTEIVQWIRKNIDKIDAMASKVLASIITLREYRTVLISNAVTGKIDLREESA